MTRKRGCLVSVLVVVLLGFGLWATCKFYDWYKYSPRLNPNPQHFLTVQGHVYPGLKDKILLKWTANYVTSNKDCEEAPDFGAYLEGAMFPREHAISYIIPVKADGSYRMKIPLDILRPGYCEWKINDLYDNLDPLSTGMQFGPCLTDLCDLDSYGEHPLQNFSQYASYKNKCSLSEDGSIDCTVQPPRESFNDENIVPRNKDYLITASYQLNP